MPYIILAIALVACAFVALILFMFQASAAKKRNRTLANSEAESGFPAFQESSNGANPLQENSRQTSGGLNYPNYGGNRPGHTGENIAYEKPGSGSLSVPGRSGSGSLSSQGYTRRNSESLAPLRPETDRYGHSDGELIRGYDRGMRTGFDDNLGAILFVTTDVVMTTPQEVTLAFQVCTRQIQKVLRAKHLERAALLTDIAGLVIGRDATASWGQALKACLDQICIKVDQDIYLVAHFNSKASRPGHEELQEKIRRIQFMTSASLNSFQSNIFDTREEGVAFLKRMREFYQV